jgi:hypothetical protein
MTWPSVDRRQAKRYDLDVDLKYLALDGSRHAQTGVGRTCNMSNSGLLLRLAAPMPEGWRSCAAVLRWPVAPSRMGSPLLLLVLGHAIRNSNSEVAISVSHHSFVRGDFAHASIESLLAGIRSEKPAVRLFGKRLKQSHLPVPTPILTDSSAANR